MTQAERVVLAQLAAFNAKDMDAFAGCFSHDIEMRTFPDNGLVVAGQKELRARYSTLFLYPGGLRVESVHRFCMGDVVCDHQRIHGLHAEPTELMCFFHIDDGRIVKVLYAHGPGF